MLSAHSRFGMFSASCCSPLKTSRPQVWFTKPCLTAVNPLTYLRPHQLHVQQSAVSNVNADWQQLSEQTLWGTSHRTADR